MKLTKKQFIAYMDNFVKRVNKVQKENHFELLFDDGGNSCLLIPESDIMFTTYFDKFLALKSLYDCSFWVEIYKNKPCVRLSIN